MFLTNIVWKIWLRVYMPQEYVYTSKHVKTEVYIGFYYL